jgi:hypothetical protein
MLGIPPLVAALLALFVVYFLGVTWQMRRAMRAPQGDPRLREARLLLLLVTAGVPLAIALVFAS